MVEEDQKTELLQSSQWEWIGGLIADVTRDRSRERLAQRYFEWEFAQRQFRKLEFNTVLTGAPSPQNLRQHRAALDHLIETAREIRGDYEKFGCEELAQLGITPDSISASIESLSLSIDYCHHGLPVKEVSSATRKIFGAAA
jgi:hypothetical protein